MNNFLQYLGDNLAFGTVPDWFIAIGVIIAAIQVFVASRANLQAAKANELAAKANELTQNATFQSFRPYVTLGLEQHPRKWRASELVLRNIGKLPATDVKISIESMPRFSDVGYDFRNARFVQRALPHLFPGQEIKTYFDNGIERTQQKISSDPGFASVEYTDENGKKYENRFALDPSTVEGTLRHEVDNE